MIRPYDIYLDPVGDDAMNHTLRADEQSVSLYSFSMSAAKEQREDIGIYYLFG